MKRLKQRELSPNNVESAATDQTASRTDTLVPYHVYLVLRIYEV